MSARPTHGAVAPLSLCVGLLALVLAVGGTAYAAGLARNSVGTPQLKKSAVTSPKLKNNAVTSAKVRNGSLRAGDLAPGVLPRTGSLDHALQVGQTGTPLVVGGVSFKSSCQSGAGSLVVAQVAVQPAVVGANNLTSSGTLVRLKGAGPSTATPIYGSSNGSSFEPNAEGESGATATTSFEGVVRSGSGPWLHVSIQARSNVVQSPPCLLRAVVTPVR